MNDKHEKYGLSSLEKKTMVKRWIAVGPPLVGAVETLGVALGGMDAPFKFIN